MKEGAAIFREDWKRRCYRSKAVCGLLLPRNPTAQVLYDGEPLISSLLCAGEAPPGALGSVLSSPAQGRWGTGWEGLTLFHLHPHRKHQSPIGVEKPKEQSPQSPQCLESVLKDPKM